MKRLSSVWIVVALLAFAAIVTGLTVPTVAQDNEAAATISDLQTQAAQLKTRIAQPTEAARLQTEVAALQTQVADVWLPHVSPNCGYRIDYPEAWTASFDKIYGTSYYGDRFVDQQARKGRGRIIYVYPENQETLATESVRELLDRLTTEYYSKEYASNSKLDYDVGELHQIGSNEHEYIIDVYLIDSNNLNYVSSSLFFENGDRFWFIRGENYYDSNSVHQIMIKMAHYFEFIGNAATPAIKLGCPSDQAA